MPTESDTIPTIH